KYERNKKLKESKKKQHVVQVKEIKLRPKTEEHDYQFKKRHAEEFLLKNNKVKFTIIFRGRELDHRELGFKMLKRAEEDLVHVGEVERPARFEGRLMVMFMKPLPQKQEQKRKKPEQKEEPPQEEKDTKEPTTVETKGEAAPAEEQKPRETKEETDAEN
ncbi:MAG: translation initiation factor IF-3, partial [Candidatus Latescibacterota bacterium]